ncbi:hypothetical protein X975_20422, partial [Stegodyphus mimosarum]
MDESNFIVAHVDISRTNNDVIDGNMNKLNKETNKSHNCKSYRCCHGNFLELLSIRLSTPLNQANRVLGKLPARLYK